MCMQWIQCLGGVLVWPRGFSFSFPKITKPLYNESIAEEKKEDVIVLFVIFASCTLCITFFSVMWFLCDQIYLHKIIHIRPSFLGFTFIFLRYLNWKYHCFLTLSILHPFLRIQWIGGSKWFWVMGQMMLYELHSNGLSDGQSWMDMREILMMQDSKCSFYQIQMMVGQKGSFFVLFPFNCNK